MTEAARADPETVTLAGVRAAVGLMARAALASDATREDILGDVAPGEALAAMEAITAGVLAGVWPRDNGAGLLAEIGLAVADLEG